MTSHDPPPTGRWLPLFLVGSAATALAAAIVAIERAPARREPKPERLGVAVPAAPAQPIAAEAQVFRTRTSMMAIEPTARREREAHPRTLGTFRYLRAYPGAPPRIPHGLTPDEFRTGACNTCHERGGYSRRFAAYVPVTPHPEMGSCLQCHAGLDEVTGISRPSSDPNARCRQCHGPSGPPRADFNAALDWRPTAWPRLPPRRPGRHLPSIPHDLQFRGNCVACHSGPAAVAEIRTAHPERTDCRQCHVAPDAEVGEFSRPATTVVAATGGAP
jgi:cytochrome c-type protein NapB